MGRRKKEAPRRGSLAYLPRGRARGLVARVRTWPEAQGNPVLLGFAGYKAGMTHAYMIESNQRSPNYGKEVVCPATVIETPPMIVCAIRTYVNTPSGLQTFSEIWMSEPPADLKRVLTLPEKFDSTKAFQKTEQNLDKIKEVRAILCTQPRLANVSQKRPELMAVKIDGGTVQQRFEYAKNLLGKPVKVSDAFKEGQFVDVVSVSKGKGLAGPVKRWGVHILAHKSRKARRAVGTLGAWHPAHVMSTVPRSGQLGLAQRTEYNKQILKIGSKETPVTPQGGFIRYGVVRGGFILLKGSVPGPAGRVIKLRHSVREEEAPEAPPQIVHISVESQQGK
mgnify:CR=1 FL=1